MQKTSSAESMTDFVGFFRGMIENPVSRRILKFMTKYCETDQASRAEVALDVLSGGRKRVCLQCKLVSLIISPFVSAGAKAFGVDDSELEQALSDSRFRKALASVLKGLAQFGLCKPFVSGAPFQVVWNITKACNMHCRHCYEEAGIKENDELTPEEVHRGIDALARAGVTILAFSGGEPTMHPHILDFARHAHARGMYVAIATNGWQLADPSRVLELKKAGVEFYQISIDGLNPTTHDQFRGVGGSWDRAVQAVRNCIEQELFVEISMTVTRHNVDEVPRMVDFARELKANWLMLYNFIPTGRGVDIIPDDLSPEERYRLLAYAYKETLKKGTQILSTAPQYATVAQILSSGKEECMIPTHFGNPVYGNPSIKRLAEFVGGCGAGRLYLSIEPNGDIYPCVFFPHAEEARVGNLLHSDFEDMWRNSELLRKLRDKDELEDNCGGCSYRFTCGGCRARAYSYLGNPLGPDPGCINNLAVWEGLKAKEPTTELTWPRPVEVKAL